MRSKTSAALLLIGIFLLGGVAGGFSYYLYQAHLAPAPVARPRPANPPDITEEMARSLNLDVQQKNQLRAIIQESREHYRTLSRGFQPQYERIRTDTNEAIRAILRPDQRKKFEDTLERMDRRRRDYPHDPPPAVSK